MSMVLYFLFISNLTFSQYWSGQEINESNLSNWIPKRQIEYEGSYHFGESESESDFNLFFSDGIIVGQVQMGY